MIEKQMIRLMLNKKFYTQYKGILSPTVFAGDISSLYETIQRSHEKYEDDIKIDELYSLHTAIFNPALTRAAKEKFSELIEDIREVQEPNKEIAKDIMRILSDRDLAQRIAVEATEIFNGKEANFTEITGMIDKHKTNVDEDKVPAVTNDVELFLPLAGLIDIEKEINRLKSNIKDIEARMNSVKKKLDNENFVKRAPENIVNHEQKKYINYKNNYDKLVENLNSLMS